VEYLLVIAGLLLLFIGGDLYIRSLMLLSDAFGISKKIAGIIIGGVGTSMPELVVCFLAAYQGHVGIVVGNVFGSNVANILLILGIGGCIHTLHFSRQLLWVDTKYLLFITAILMLFSASGALYPWMAGFFLILLLSYYVWVYYHDSNSSDQVEQQDINLGWGIWVKGACFFALGLFLLILGSDLFIDYSVIIARKWDVSETVIGLTIVAIGTSLPEVAACVMAALKRQVDLVIGNVIGSCIFNILGVFGFSLWFAPMPVPKNEWLVDGGMVLFATLILAGLVFRGGVLKKHGAMALLAVYFGYIFVLAPLAH